jgi:hypothetical protein
MNQINTERVLNALKRMIELDETNMCLDAPNGTFHPDENDAYWLTALQEAQQAYYEATGELVRSSNNILLVPGKDEL